MAFSFLKHSRAQWEQEMDKMAGIYETSSSIDEFLVRADLEGDFKAVPTSRWWNPFVWHSLLKECKRFKTVWHLFEVGLPLLVLPLVWMDSVLGSEGLADSIKMAAAFFSSTLALAMCAVTNRALDAEVALARRENSRLDVENSRLDVENSRLDVSIDRLFAGIYAAVALCLVV